MLETVFLDRALCLPAIDIAALLQGQLIAIIPNAPVQRGWTFALCPYIESSSVLSIRQQYHQHILPLAQSTVAQQQASTIAIEAWAKCVDYKMLYEVEQLEALSRLTIWTQDLLKKALQQRQHLLLAFLQVYRMPELIKLPLTQISPEKFGKFVGLPILNEELQKPVKITQLLPVLSVPDFAKRKQQLEELRPPLHPELEELQSAIAHLSATFPTAKALEQDIRVFIGGADDYTLKSQPDLNLSWIRMIAKIGNSSDGDLFEKLVRKSLVYLGFSNRNFNPQASLDPTGCGGAGGLDFYCESPYQVVGECKATKTEMVPDGTPAQLVKLGHKHLQKEYANCIKIILAAGELNSHAKLTASGNEMNVIRPETLQRLVELKVNHPGSINLIDLKPCLEAAPFGEEADFKLNEYISKIKKEIKIRSHLIQAMSQLNSIEPERTQFEASEIRVQYNAVFGKGNNCILDSQTVHEMLIELSSPLAGHVGRIKVSGLNSDRFYYLRDLKLDP